MRQANCSLMLLASSFFLANLFSSTAMVSAQQEQDPCSQINPGDISFELINTQDPDQVVFQSSVTIPGNLKLFLTDQAWDGTQLVESTENEGSLVFTTPPDGLYRSQNFGYGPDMPYGDQWSPVDGNFSLNSDQGDNIFLYCKTNSTSIDFDEFRFLAGVSTSGVDWGAPGLSGAEYGESHTSLPASLFLFGFVLPHHQNYRYIGAFLFELFDPIGWEGSNDVRYTLQGSRVVPVSTSSSSTTIAPTTNNETIQASRGTTPAAFGTTSSSSSTTAFDGCDIATYYQGLLDDSTLTSSNPILRDTVTRLQLETLLEGTHRGVVPYSHNSRDDVWNALMDLDVGKTSGTVHLLYRNIDVPAIPYGVPDTWNREHLFPKSLGVGGGGADYTDLHHLRASDWNVNAARGNKYFGDCGLVHDLKDCKIPAHRETSNDTAADTTVFLPPAAARGEIARALLYMDLRYSAENNQGVDLQLTDCPIDAASSSSEGDTATTNQMAYLSQLLEWHLEFPPTEREQLRNQKTCQRWQGNRNVFVDFPNLVTKLYGAPQKPLGEGLGYSSCETQQSEDISIYNNEQCASLEPGDIMMVDMSASDPEGVAFVALVPLEEGLVLKLTDNAWTGSQFASNEGTLSLQIPAGGVAEGTVFGYGLTNSDLFLGKNWRKYQGAFDLSASGDSILLYCDLKVDELDGDPDSENSLNIQFLYAFDYSGNGWQPASLDATDFGSHSTALPITFEQAPWAALSLPHFDRYRYSGKFQGSKTTLQITLSDPMQWSGQNGDGDEDIVIPASMYFDVLSEEVEYMVDGISIPASSRLGPGDIMVVAMDATSTDDKVAMVALIDLPPGLPIFLTDNAWTGDFFRRNEGTITLTLPETGLVAGTVFGYGTGLYLGDKWQPMQGRFALSEAGDTIFVYTLAYTDNDPVVICLCALGYGSHGWKESGFEENDYDTNESALPPSLQTVGSIFLPLETTYEYIGISEGTKASLQEALQNPIYWVGGRIFESAAISAFSFTIHQAAPPNSSGRCLASIYSCWRNMLPGIGLVLVAIMGTNARWL